MRLTEGVSKVDGVRVANVYLVAIDDGLLLVDTGMPGNAKRIVAFMESIGRQAADLRYIVLTHCDLDHIGSVAGLKELTGARVAIHELDGPVLAREQRPQKGGRVMVATYRGRFARPILVLRTIQLRRRPPPSEARRFRSRCSARATARRFACETAFRQRRAAESVPDRA